jgi:O-antigen ligase
MTQRSPPRLATWILLHVASDYRHDSLIGDLIEEFEHGKTRVWYWKQVFAALGVTGAKRLRTALTGSAANSMLRVAAESLAVTGLVSLAFEMRRASEPATVVLPELVAATALLCLVTSLCLSAPIRPKPHAKLKAAIKRLLAALAVITLSTATLTWAGTTAPGATHVSDAAACAETR